MITTPIFTRLLPKEKYGLASTYVAWQNVLTLVVTLSLYKSLMNLFRDHDDQDAVTTSVSTLSILVSGIWVALGIVFSRRCQKYLECHQYNNRTICLFYSASCY